MPLAMPDIIDDNELARRATGDREALAALYQRHVDGIYRYCFRRLRNREAAEDATQIVFERAMLNISRFEARSSFRAWLFTIAHNEVIDHVRRMRPVADPEALDLLHDPGPSPEALAIERDEHDGLRKVIARLDERDRQLVELRLSGLNDREIADVLGISHGAVRTRQHRTLMRMREFSSSGGRS
jgi:RNA polymerase sigma-70 factor (ECF subfamily)